MAKAEPFSIDELTIHLDFKAPEPSDRMPVGRPYDSPAWHEWMNHPANRWRLDEVARLDAKAARLRERLNLIELERHSLLGGWAAGLPTPNPGA